MNFEQCFTAKRPLIFVVSESDTELLRNIERLCPSNQKAVYSTTLAQTMPLSTYMKPNEWTEPKEAQTTVGALDSILNINIPAHQNVVYTYVFLDCDSYINDSQVIRKIKDLMFRYQMDEDFTINLIMASHRICVPPQLERLSEMVFFDLPTEAEIKVQSDYLTDKLELKGDKAPTEDTVSNLKGMTLFEVEQAYLQSFSMYKGIELGFIRDFKKNSIAKTDLLSLMETQVTFDDVGGLDRFKAWVKKSGGGWTVEGKKFGLPLLKGVLLVGLPGAGKSLSAKALGTLWGLPVVDFDPSKVFSSRVGDSESNMRRVLQIVECLSPCILMLDEIEKGLAGLQSSTYSDSGVTARVIRSFLVWMQENNKPVFVVATANNIAAMPPELISRFDAVFFVGLPQLAERKEIFRIHLKRLNRDPNNFDLDLLAQNSQDLSGREIEQALKEAMYDAFHKGVELNTVGVVLTLNSKTTLVTTMAEQLKALLKWVGWDKDKNDGLRARFASTPEPGDISRVRDEIEALLKDIAEPLTGSGPEGV